MSTSFPSAPRPGPRAEHAIAVVGMAGRFPGARSVSALWHRLLAGDIALHRFSAAELRAAGVDEALLADPDYVPVKGLLPDIECFDERCFDYSAREAALLDPQHRLFLECAWHALEEAGIDPARAPGAVGVFAGAGMSTYLLELAAHPALRERDGLFDLLLHNAPDYLATRVAYKAGLTGPALTVQTGCSTSLVAIHVACQSLLAGECDAAIAGGVTARAPQRRGYLSETGSPLSRDGRCLPFDARASGTVPGEAVAAVVLKRVEDALRAGDHIHALVAGSAINNDGDRKVGFTAPSIDGQCAAICEALEVAGVAPRTIGLVEAHGTATRLGDPLEVAALTRALRTGTADRQFCALGALKANIGHVDAAAGVAAFIKAVLCVEHGLVPPASYFEAPSPDIDFAASPLYISPTLVRWGTAGELRRAGVSAFGLGGTNAHAILEQAPPPAPRPAHVQVPAGPHLLVLSARTPAALDRATAALGAQLAELAAAPAASGAEALADLAFTARTARKQLEHRRAVIAADARSAAAAIASGHPVAVRAGRQRTRTLGLVFPGGGSQHAHMGRELYESEPTYREAIDRCAAIAAPLVGRDVRSLLYPAAAAEAAAEDALRAPRYGVPAVWMTSYALVELLASWGVVPAFLLGHSLGEYVAACVAGTLSLRDALTLATARAVAAERCEPGASVIVSLPAAELRALLPAGVEIAAVNTPTSCVASGPIAAVDQLMELLAARGDRARRLPIAVAVHCSLMDPVMPEVRRLARALELRPPRIPYFSNLHGRLIEPGDLTPDYWADHLRHTVRFSDCVRAALAQPGCVMLEVGPGTSLTSAVTAHVAPDSDAVALPAMRAANDPRGDREVLLTAVGAAWTLGVPVDLRAQSGGAAAEAERRRAPFPLYSFEPTRHWIDGPARAAAPGAPAEPGTPPRPPEPIAPGPAAPAVALPPDLAGDPLAAAVAEAWAEQLGAPTLSADANFFALGGTSLLAVRLIARLQRRLGPARRLAPEDLLRAPDLGAFVAHLRATGLGGAAPAPPGAPVLLRAGSVPGAPPLVLVHPAGGHVLHYRLLAEAIDPRLTVLGLKAPGVDDDRPIARTVEALAELHLRALRDAGLGAAPYALAGSSFGGCVAYEMAQQLAAVGERVALLALVDTPAPDDLPTFTDHADYVDYLFGDMWGVRVAGDELRALPKEQRVPHALRQLAAAGVELGLDAAAAERVVEIFVASEAALRAYRPRPLRGGAVYLRAAERRPRDPAHPERGWLRHAGSAIAVEVVPGNHLTMHEVPHVGVLAERLGAHAIAALGLPLPPSRPSTALDETPRRSP